MATTVVAALGLGIVASNADAGERRFSFLYDATTHGPGEVEIEHWATWKTDKASDGAFDRLEFRHEIEIGLTDQLQLGLYVADWRYQDGASVSNDGAEYRDTAIELIRNLSDPILDPVGVAIYGELKLGPELFELEGKLILEKGFGRWTAGYNATIEAEWEGDDYADDKGEFEQSFGLSYQVSPSLTIGAELVHEIEFPDWSATGDSIVYLGPNTSVHTESWWFTLTPLFQVTDVDTAVDFQLRLIFGMDF